MCIGCIVKCLEECINTTAYAFFVGIYGHSFLKVAFCFILRCQPMSVRFRAMKHTQALSPLHAHIHLEFPKGRLRGARIATDLPHHQRRARGYRDPWAASPRAADTSRTTSSSKTGRRSGGRDLQTDAEVNLIMMGAAIGWGSRASPDRTGSAVLIIWKEKSEYLGQPSDVLRRAGLHLDNMGRARCVWAVLWCVVGNRAAAYSWLNAQDSRTHAIRHARLFFRVHTGDGRARQGPRRGPGARKREAQITTAF